MTPAAPVIDAHAHVFLPASKEYPRGVDALAPAERTAPVETFTRALDAAGVDAAVLVPLDAHDRYVAEVVAARPDRFAGIAVAGDDLRGAADPVAALTARRADYPFAALRMTWLGDPRLPIDVSPLLPVLRYLAEQRLPLWSYLPPDQLPLLEGAVAAVPDLLVVLNHLGFCPHAMRVDEHGRPAFDDPFPSTTTAALQRLADSRGVHVLFSGQYALSREAPPYRDLDAVVDSLVSWYGPERMLWASDFPWTARVPGYAALADLPRRSLTGLDERALAEVRGATASRLFPQLSGRSSRST